MILKSILSIIMTFFILTVGNGTGFRVDRKDNNKIYTKNGIVAEQIYIETDNNPKMPVLILTPQEHPEKTTGVLWIHGGGYLAGMKETVYSSRAMELVRDYGCVVVTPDYTLSLKKPYPAAVEDCYSALLYLKNNADELEVRDDQLMVGGGSAGGGLTAAVCIMARDRGEVNIAFQMPLYPMLDNHDTESSAHNHGIIWNTNLNHIGWRLYLRKDAKNDVSPYASPASLTDYSGLPPAYSFVGSGEPFYAETIDYIEKLNAAGIESQVDVYKTSIHSFDTYFSKTKLGKAAAKNFDQYFEYAQQNYFAPQNP